ncbi:phospholipase D/nuclease [Hesseltinella vesiculosa]|uniref:Phospholipase n=1 Tax=Hesseltinella vesiculosa TaxID=101127 RepID=A0A1X2G5A6_9FUNG|nr:phospholipase D/nuclease [Hesseltinella vesiculosa]
MNLLPAMLLAEVVLGDDHGQSRIPVILPLLRLHVDKVSRHYPHGHSNLAISISYGSAQWTVYRRYWDFIKLHYAYREDRQPVHSSGSSSHSTSSVPNNMDKVLQTYLVQLMNALQSSGKINRLCKFLEISTLGLNLDAQAAVSYHGKEGYLIIAARSIREPRYDHSRFGAIGRLFGQHQRHTRAHAPKWFMVRDNCLICVDHPSQMDYYDVFLFDPKFRVHRGYSHILGDKPKQLQKVIKSAARTFSLGHSTLVIETSQGDLYLHAKNVEQAILFEQSIHHALKKSFWCIPKNRFNSFAPVRRNSPCTWFVDGKDYFYELSVALDNAKSYIYIHDWWLYLRRPASQYPTWRLDQVLKRKADEGVKIYVIVYKEVAVAIPLSSHYTKTSLLALSDNVYVQRHPSRALDMLNKDNTLFWAQHEKLCLVDGVVAFLGGLDLCYGRWDTCEHNLTDDPPLGSNHQVWLGKDYSNPRIEDFSSLDKPFEDGLDRSRFPRMPWHDVSVRILGDAVNDIDRHFVERWNYLRRRKSAAPKRDTPLLLPQAQQPLSSFTSDPRISQPPTSIHSNVQILRSVCSWSIGHERVEHSIMDAYVELIEKSNHFVYIENQFFVTSTKVGSTVIENKIGDALYRRIVQAHERKENWHAMILLPLMPGFPGSIDLNDGATVRRIMQCQYASIGRGPDSLLGRLHAAGIKYTSSYISFFGLRHWGSLNGRYTTEQIYIHSKTMIVDDTTVIIGSANINERSMLGTRDSEIAACIQDTEMISSTMGNRPVQVGKFAHSLRLRLMAEHLGLPVAPWDLERLLTNRGKFDQGLDAPPISAPLSPAGSSATFHAPLTPTRMTSSTSLLKDVTAMPTESSPPSAESVATTEVHILGSPYSSTATSSPTAPPTSPTLPDKQEPDEGADGLPTENAPSRRASCNHVPLNEHGDEAIAIYRTWASWDTDTNNNGDETGMLPLPLPMTLENNHTVIYHQTEELLPLPCQGSPPTSNSSRLSLLAERPDPADDLDVFSKLVDPLMARVWLLGWARTNTDLFRRCFMVMPDNNVRTWESHGSFIKLARLLLSKTEVTTGTAILETHPTLASNNTYQASVSISTATVHLSVSQSQRPPNSRTSLALSESSRARTSSSTMASATNLPMSLRPPSFIYAVASMAASAPISTSSHNMAPVYETSSTMTNFVQPFIHHLLQRIRGHLVIWPVHFMEDEKDEFVFAMDRLAPLDIFD